MLWSNQALPSDRPTSFTRGCGLDARTVYPFMQMRMSDGSPSPPSPESRGTLNPAAKSNAKHNGIDLGQVEARALKISVNVTKLQPQYPPVPAYPSQLPPAAFLSVPSHA